ncbi:hypothetical protein BXT84_09110 [Sulfobacillus thermotolerans]|uniref:Haloacid dehalogenase n=1 Tax=Sulfobacillus thermotolerans TaxID=338644 RepID=A0ABM6RRZ7_9FIRM|nr:hypothetical protein BXT84_09110 [Sulfobacillus thermotolerans]
MPTSPILLLWDIDGTLLLVPGAGASAMTQTFQRLFAIPNAFAHVEFAGGTDSYIVDSAFQQHHLDHQQYSMLFKTAYCRQLSRTLKEYPGHILPGVSQLLQTLHKDPRFDLSLATGNYRDAAYIKLAHFGLDHYFPIGGFAEDGYTRDAIMTAARNNTERYYQKHYTSCVVIADTVQDGLAAKQCGYPLLAVATGKQSIQDLQTVTPYVVPSLEDSSLVHLLLNIALSH